MSISNLSKSALWATLSLILCGCAEFSPHSPPQFCYGPPGSKLVPPPANEQALFEAAKNYKGPANNEFPPNHPRWNRFYKTAWYQTADGKLHLCREPVSAIDSCENQTYVFERVNGAWKLKYGIQGFCTG